MVTVGVVGGGLIGAACAAALARLGHEVFLLERNAQLGLEISSRNSEVIHAGIYDPPGSLKAELCVAGRVRLYHRCGELGIPHRRLGKLILADGPSGCERLEALEARARANGAGEVEWLEPDQIARLEPEVRAEAALLSPESGIVDTQALLASYLAEAESHGAQVVTRTRLEALERRGPGWRLETRGPDGDRFDLDVAWVVNAAGLDADRVAEMAGLDPDTLGWRIHPCKGDYFALAPATRLNCRRLLYPLPVAGGLGIHLTLDLGGRYRLGPDVEWIDSPSYTVDPTKAEAFAAAARAYLPTLRASDLVADFAGIRPKLGTAKDGFRDFVIEDSETHGAPGMVHLVGIESPGLTAAGEIGERVADLLTAAS